MSRNISNYNRTLRLDSHPINGPKVKAVKLMKCKNCRKNYYTDDYSSRFCTTGCRAQWGRSSEHEYQSFFGEVNF